VKRKPETRAGESQLAAPGEALDLCMTYGLHYAPNAATRGNSALLDDFCDRLRFLYGFITCPMPQAL